MYKRARERTNKHSRCLTSSIEHYNNTQVIIESTSDYFNFTTNYFTNPTPPRLDAFKFDSITPFKGKYQEKSNISNKVNLAIINTSGSNVIKKCEPVNPRFNNSKRIKLTVTGRPLTATYKYKNYKEKPHQRPQSYARKGESIFSYGDSEDISPLDPKFYDEEYTHFDEHTQFLLSQPVNNILNTQQFSLLQLDKFQEHQALNERKSDLSCKIIQENVKSPYQTLFFTIKSDGADIPSRKRPKGKIIKGRCNKSWVPLTTKTIHNLKLS